ncbi:hypothetical protein DL93DRAFT_397594 [Clavulina sp. PMI_390]|nr:hypothetical protein DL93DRAFT_397594 [Clavulina sp. PMI_390]
MMPVQHTPNPQRNPTPMLPPAVIPNAAENDATRAKTPRPTSAQAPAQAQTPTGSRPIRPQPGASPAAAAGSPKIASTPTAAASSPVTSLPTSPARKAKATPVPRKAVPQPKRKGSVRSVAGGSSAPVEILDDTPAPVTVDTPSPASGSSKRVRQDEPADPSAVPGVDGNERSPKRSKLGEGEAPSGPAPDEAALAATLATALENPENAVSFQEAAIADFTGYQGLTSLGTTGPEEITVGTVGGSDAPSLEELLQQVSTQAASGQGQTSFSGPAPSLSSAWLQKDADTIWLSGSADIPLRSISSMSQATVHDSAFDISSFFDISNLAYDDPDDSLRVTATPELLPASNSQGPTPNSILESPAGAGHARHLDASPKGLRETATDHPLTNYSTSGSSDFYREIGIPEAPHFHRSSEFLFDGEMSAGGEWPISFGERTVSSTA